MANPIQVKLKAHTNQDALDLITLAAKECYQQKPAWYGQKINEQELFAAGHHTPFQHFYLTWQVENIGISDINFGLHLTHPFYVSDQRSGSYCAKMFNDPDYDLMADYINYFWSDLDTGWHKKIQTYLNYCFSVYQTNYKKAEQVTKKLLKKERPYADDKYLKEKSPKITQEQLRMFIPSIFPTGIIYSLNLISLASLYESAWNPVLRHVTQQMADQVIAKFPALSYLFSQERRRKDDWSPAFENEKSGQVIAEVTAQFEFEPDLKHLEVNQNGFTLPEYRDLYPLDKLHYKPELMDNSLEDIKAQVQGPLVTMGQDQRHRTLKRSQPIFTGNFYLPPIAKILKLEKEAKMILEMWQNLGKNIPATLKSVIAPLGAMVRYKKKGSLNAIAHEHSGRLCWFHQREIYELSRQLRSAIKQKLGKNSVVDLFEPPCYRSGKCTRGHNYCGRDLLNRKEENYFDKRNV
ncbi:MAG: hypothetical protein GF332_00300 [Candidatus Moranbacteria bacterium]|nr:hypothetical protein [Candidatus Moranbacteria bacterium]